MTEAETTHKIEFAHDTLYQSGFPFAVLAYESYFLASAYLHIDILQNGMFAVSLSKVFDIEADSTRMRRRRKP